MNEKLEIIGAVWDFAGLKAQSIQPNLDEYGPNWQISNGSHVIFFLIFLGSEHLLEVETKEAYFLGLQLKCLTKLFLVEHLAQKNASKPIRV